MERGVLLRGQLKRSKRPFREPPAAGQCTQASRNSPPAFERCGEPRLIQSCTNPILPSASFFQTYQT